MPTAPIPSIGTKLQRTVAEKYGHSCVALLTAFRRRGSCFGQQADSTSGLHLQRISSVYTLNQERIWIA